MSRVTASIPTLLISRISGLTFAETLGTKWSTGDPSGGSPARTRRVAPDAAVQRRSHCRRNSAFCGQTRALSGRGSTAPRMNDGREANGRVKTVEDISERKSAEFALRVVEEALFEERERAQVTLDSIGDAVLTTDLQGKVTYLNLAAEAMTGWSREEALGRPLSEVFHIIDGATRRAAPDPAQCAIEENRTVGWPRTACSSAVMAASRRSRIPPLRSITATAASPAWSSSSTMSANHGPWCGRWPIWPTTIFSPACPIGCC
jgi:PAS domain-containing protein